MSKKKDENEINENSFEYEDRISNVIITPKNKQNQNNNSKMPLKDNTEKVQNGRNKFNTINYNSKSDNTFEENSAGNNKVNIVKFSNLETQFLNGMKTQMGFSGSQNLNEIDQRKLFENFLLFQKFLLTQTEVNNGNIDFNNFDSLEKNLKESLNSNRNLFQNVNGDSNLIDNGKIKNKGEEKSFNSVPVPPDYIHQRKKSIGTLSNSSIVNEFKRSITNNSNTLDKAGSLEKNPANTIELDKSKISLEDKRKLIINHEEIDNIKNLNETIEDKKIKTQQISHINDNLSSSINKSGFNRLKNRNKATSLEYEKVKIGNVDNENRRSFRENSKTVLAYNSDINPKLNKSENKPLEFTPNKDLEFSNRSSFDVKKENMPMPNNYENISPKKPERNQNNKSSFINTPLSNKLSDKNININLNALIMNNNHEESYKVINKLESNDSIKKIDDTLESKNRHKNLNQKLKLEEFMPNKENMLNLNNINDNNNATENASKIDNFDDIPIKSSHSNFLELFEKNLAEEANIYGTINKEVNNENKKPANARRNNPRFKKEIIVSAPTKEEKKYKYYSDNFEEKTIEARNDHENNKNDRISFGNYQTEKPQTYIDKKNGVASRNYNSKKAVYHKSVEKTNCKRLDNPAKLQEDKSFNLNGNLSGSTHIPNSKGKYSTKNSKKNSKLNPLR